MADHVINIFPESSLVSSNSMPTIYLIPQFYDERRSSSHLSRTISQVRLGAFIVKIIYGFLSMSNNEYCATTNLELCTIAYVLLGHNSVSKHVHKIQIDYVSPSCIIVT